MSRRRRQKAQALLDEVMSERDAARAAQHRAELGAARAEGELRGYRTAFDRTTVLAREAARAAVEFAGADR